MQIHELDTFIGTTSDSTYLAIDDGTETNKIPATDLGITTEMTQAEAEAGTETAPRVISPAVLNSFVAGQITNTIIIENYSCGSNTVNSSGAIAKDIDVSASIPDGYKLVGVIPRSTGAWWLYFYNCAVVNDHTIRINLYRPTSSNTTATQVVALICQSV